MNFRIKTIIIILSVCLTHALFGQDGLEHFNPVAKTGLYNQVRIEDATLNGVTLNSGDEIAVYDSTLCVGASKVDEFPLNVTVSLAGDYVEGAEPGNKMKFRIWDKETDRELFVVDYPGVDTNVKFSQGGVFSKQYPLTVADYIKAWVRNVTFQTIPSGLIYSVNDVQYSRKDTLACGEGDTLYISTQDIQPVSSDTRYNFHYWNGVAPTQCTKVDTIYIVESADNNLTANFQKEYYLELTSDHGVPSGEGWYVDGQDVNISINTPIYNDVDGKRYAFTQWEEEYGTEVYPDPDTTVTLDEPKTLIAQWKTQYRLTIEQDPPEGGDITIDDIPLVGNVNWEDDGTVVNIKTTVNYGNNYEFNGWSGSVISSDTSITLSMTKPKSLTAHYKRFVVHTINSEPSGLEFYIDGDKYDTEQTDIEWYENNTHILKVDSILYDESNPNKRYVFTHWSSDETITSTEYNYEVTTPMNSIVITAHFKVQYKVDIESEQGTVSLVDEENNPITDGWCDGNTSVVFSVAPDTILDAEGKRYIFDGWTKGNDDSYTGKDNPHTIFVNNYIEEIAQWNTEFKLTITEFQDKGGDVKLDPDHLSKGGWYLKNTNVELDLSLAGGYQWFGWDGDLDGDTYPVNVTMDTSKNITANFAKEVEVTIDSDPASLDFEVIPYGSEEPESYTTPHTFTWLSAREYTIRVDSTILLEPDFTTRYTIESWSNHSGKDTNYVYTVPDYKSTETITVDYLIEYLLEISSTHDGSVRGNPYGEGWYKANTTVEFGIQDSISSGSAGTRYKFLEWNGTGEGSYSGSSLSYTVTMNNPKKEEASWVTQYNFSLASMYGTYWITPSRDNGWYEEGMDVEFGMNDNQLVETIGPGVQYAFTGWEIDYYGTVVTVPDTSYTVSMDTPIEVNALWPLQYKLTTIEVPNQGGDIIPAPPGAWYNADTYAKVDTVQVNNGYNWNGWSISGSIDNICPKFILMDSPKTVEALFGETTVCVINTYPSGLPVEIEDVNYIAPHTLRWLQGSTHELSARETIEEDFTRYYFNSWSHSGFRTFLYTVPATVDTDSVTAYYDINYRLIVNTDHSTVSGTGWFAEGQNASFRVMDEQIDDNGLRYQFKGWHIRMYDSDSKEWIRPPDDIWATIPDTTKLSSYLIMNYPYKVIAVWDTLYQLTTTINVDTAGTIVRKPDKEWMSKGSVDTLTAVPAADGAYIFGYWSGDVGSNDINSSTITILMDKEKSVQANFTGVYHTLTKEIKPESKRGTITLTPDRSQYLHSSKVTVEAVPNSGYVFSHWEGAVSGKQRIVQFNINSDDTVTAHFGVFDTSPPEVTDCYPPKNATQVAVNTDIEFKVTDNVYGVNLSTLDVLISGNKIIDNGQDKTGGLATIHSVERGYRIFYSPSTDFDSSTTVSVNVKCSDTAKDPNSADNTYQFSTGTSSIENPTTETFVPSSSRVIEHSSGVKVTIPAGALPDTTDIIIAVLDNPPALPDTVNGVGLTYYLGPAGLQFNIPVTVSFPVDSSMLTEAGVFSLDALRLMYFSTATGSWQEVEVVSVSATEVTIEVDHFSYFTLAAWKQALAPEGFADIYNYPNPFNPDDPQTAGRTEIWYELSKNAEISIKIFDVAGALVTTLEENKQCTKSIEYQCWWDGRNDQGDIVANNVYFCVIESSSGDREVRKIAVLR